MQNIKSESEFENHIREDILKDILDSKGDFKLFDFKKAVDILIAKNGQEPELFFIEIKYHIKSHGRLGFGDGKGSGFQPEVLKNETAYFEKNMRWILGLNDNERYWFVNNKTLRNYFSGGSVGQKQNNIQAKFFDEVESLSRNELKNEITNWMNKK